MDPRLKFASDVTVKDGVITVVLSNEAVDRDGDVVRAAGWDLGNFTKAPRLMSCHDYGKLTSQIGEWRNVRVDPERKALVGEPHYYRDQGNPEADWGFYLASIGQATYSVGFTPLDAEPHKGHSGNIFTRQELLECSHVPIPSNPEALQLMAKALRARTGKSERKPGDLVQKWDSRFMDNTAASGGYTDLIGSIYGADVRCLVPGCDDAAQTIVNICSEHLKVLINAEPEPAGSPPDDDDLMLRAFTAPLRRTLKAGRVVSTANMTKLHSAMQSLKDVHDAACTDDDCPLDEEPPAAADKSVKAMGEGGSSEGGVTVSDSGTHGAFTGTHSHAHAANGAQGGDAGHSHEHSHDGSGDHGHAHGKGAGVAEQTATKSFDLNAALDAVLAGVEW